MQPKVVIRSIKEQYLLTAEQYEALKSSLGQPIRLVSPWWDEQGKLISMAVCVGEYFITLFPSNKVKGEFSNGIEFRLS